ncbi:MAG TPA: acyl-CoA dehydrogenase family protein, partial [Marmoricola sp.]
MDTTARDEVREEIRSVVTDVLDKGGATWAACADAGLLGLAAPESCGGEGLGLGEVGVLLHEVGRRALDLPVWETVACGLLTIAASGTPELQRRLVPEIIAGTLLVAPAQSEAGAALPRTPLTTLRDGLVTGHKVDVPALSAPAGGRVLLMVSTDGGVVLVDPTGPGVSATPNYASRDTPSSTAGAGLTGYVFDEAPAVEVLDDTAATVLREHAVAGLLLLGDGLVAGALDLTAGYVRERSQFGRRLA